MAKMVPPTIPDDTKSDGEVEIFNYLAAAPGTESWTVIHSLDIARHISQVSGEVDFIIFVPKLGVLCLEVKACRTLRRSGGEWFYGQKQEPDARGPFKQADAAKHSVLQFLRQKLGQKIGAPFFSLVAFTHLTFFDKSPEWHSWQVIDKAKIDRDGLVLCLMNALKAGRSDLEEKPAGSWLKNERDAPSSKQIETLISLLRPEFEYFESPASRKKYIYDEVKKYTEEQFAALDFAEQNSRVMFGGPAGTGKTLLAIETARREIAAGNRVLFLCYNEMLSHKLKEELRLDSSKNFVGNISSFMLRTCGIGPKENDEFWDHELPSMTKAHLLEKPERFDTLVIDEAQDFMNLSFIDCLECCISGGLRNGRIRMFGDFLGQSIQKSEITPKELKEGWIHDLSYFKLSKNCRNTPRVASLATGFTNGIIKYSSVLRGDDGIEPNIIVYDTADDQSQKLIETLSAYKNEGIQLDEIAVLSCKRQGWAAQALISMVSADNKSANISGRLANGLICTTIRRFKGMERFGIIVTDIDNTEQNHFSELLYVASTRAVGRLTLLVQRQALSELKK